MEDNELTLEKVFHEIYPGWRNWVFHDPKMKELAIRRGAICKDCEHLNHFIRSKRWGMKCGKCGCPIAMKVYSPTTRCPMGKW